MAGESPQDECRPCSTRGERSPQAPLHHPTLSSACPPNPCTISRTPRGTDVADRIWLCVAAITLTEDEIDRRARWPRRRASRSPARGAATLPRSSERSARGWGPDVRPRSRPARERRGPERLHSSGRERRDRFEPSTASLQANLHQRAHHASFRDPPVREGSRWWRG